MQTQPLQSPTQTQAGVLNELQLGGGICNAVKTNSRADFALLVAMFSNDVRETTPVESVKKLDDPQAVLRKNLGVPESQPLRSDAESYGKSAHIAQQFHQSGIQAAKLQQGLTPDALAYMTENTHDLGEEVYRNLSNHSLRTLKSEPAELNSDGHLYNELLLNRRQSQIQAYA